jgi:RNA polymerase sigma factor (sigma-70 family)
MPNPAASGHENDDKRLVAAVVNGDEPAFRKLIHQHEKLVISIVYKMVIRKEDCEDICQDVFLRVYEKLPGFRFDSKLSTWVGSIAFNACINFLQKRKPVLLDDLRNAVTDEEMGQPPGITVADTGSSPVEKLEMKEQEALLHKNMLQLSAIQRTVLQLFHQHEFSLQEVAEVTDLTVSTVKSHLFRARKELKEMMTNY